VLLAVRPAGQGTFAVKVPGYGGGGMCIAIA
jgi:hypothetical protein